MSHYADLDPVTGNIIISFPYDMGLVNKVKEIPGAKWDSQNKYWLVPSYSFASVFSVLGGFSFGSSLIQMKKNWDALEKVADLRAQGLISSIDFTKPFNSRTLFPHQADGVKEILTRKRLILADEMGLGKTTTSLIALGLTGIPIYVVAPKSLHVNWQREADMLGVPVTSIISWAKIPDPPKHEYCVVFDEAHAMQSMLSQRTKKALVFASMARYVIPVTGTPIKNGRPSNLFALLAAIKHPLSFMKKQFDINFCNAHPTRFSKWDCTGVSNLDVLFTSTQGSLLRRTKEDCLNLPPKIRTLKVAEVTPAAEQVYKDIFNMLRDRWKRRVTANEIVSTNEKLVMFMQLRRAASWAKLYQSETIGEELSENNKQAVYFTAFTETCKILADRLSSYGSVGLITGEVSQPDRQTAIDMFQRGELKFIVCTFGAGGVGITLNSAHHVILHDRPWTPGDALQAEDRCHRIGQSNTVFSYWIQCNGTDQSIDGLILRKSENISEILAGNKTSLALGFDVREEVDSLFDEIFSQ